MEMFLLDKHAEPPCMYTYVQDYMSTLRDKSKRRGLRPQIPIQYAILFYAWDCIKV